LRRTRADTGAHPIALGVAHLAQPAILQDAEADDENGQTNCYRRRCSRRYMQTSQTTPITQMEPSGRSLHFERV
jgi:hypothetical protein